MRAFGSPTQRAAHYREQAGQLRELAATAVRGSHRKQLAGLADEYESLADTTEKT
jgi:hypothetical protein